MPLPDDASLYIPYTVIETSLRPSPWVAVQVQDEDILYMSAVSWPTQAEAERHAHDLNYLREQAVNSMAKTTLWVAIDVASDGPDGVVILERVLHGKVIGWRLLNPANDEDDEAWKKHRDMVRNALDALAQEELPEDDETLGVHVMSKHGVHDEDPMLTDKPGEWWVAWHRRQHDDPTAEYLDHTHEWQGAEEVDDDASSDAPEGAHEDAGS